MRYNREVFLFIQSKTKLYTGMLTIVMLAMVVLMGSISFWANNRGEAVCVPLGENVFPMIPYLPVVTEEQDDAKLFTFIEKYIKSTFDERIVNYHRPTNLGRYSDAFLKDTLLDSIEMSLGSAKEENMKKYANSDETARQLRACKCGWIFNIHAIESIQKTNFNGVVHATILGEFQVTYDGAKTNLPHRLWGFKRIWLTISQGTPSRTSKGEYKNKYGLYVSSQEIEAVPYELRDKLNQQMMIKGFYVP